MKFQHNDPRLLNFAWNAQRVDTFYKMLEPKEKDNVEVQILHIKIKKLIFDI